MATYIKNINVAACSGTLAVSHRVHATQPELCHPGCRPWDSFQPGCRLPDPRSESQSAHHPGRGILDPHRVAECSSPASDPVVSDRVPCHPTVGSGTLSVLHTCGTLQATLTMRARTLSKSTTAYIMRSEVSHLHDL